MSTNDARNDTDTKNRWLALSEREPRDRWSALGRVKKQGREKVAKLSLRAGALRVFSGDLLVAGNVVLGSFMPPAAETWRS